MTHTPKLRLALLAAAILFLLPATAQTTTQHGVARMITHNAKDPVRPVSNVRIVVGNSASKASDAQGRFTLNITKKRDNSFTLTDVKLPKGSKLILVSPKRNAQLHLSKNDLEVAFITSEERQTVSSATYQRLVNKYNAQAQQLRELRTQIENQQMEFDESSAEYARLKQRRDSVQSLLLQYFDEKQRERILQEMQRVADELAMTDYMSLDSLERHIFELKSAGEWSELSKLLRDVMNNDPEGYIMTKADKRNATKADLQQGLRLLRENITALKKQQLYDSVSSQYAAFTDVDSTNWAMLCEAARFERDTLAHYDLAADYLRRAIAHAPTDAVRAELNAELVHTLSLQAPSAVRPKEEEQ